MYVFRNTWVLYFLFVQFLKCSKTFRIWGIYTQLISQFIFVGFSPLFPIYVFPVSQKLFISPKYPFLFRLHFFALIIYSVIDVKVLCKLKGAITFYNSALDLMDIFSLQNYKILKSYGCQFQFCSSVLAQLVIKSIIFLYMSVSLSSVVSKFQINLYPILINPNSLME